jgi:hypothetical protein
MILSIASAVATQLRRISATGLGNVPNVPKVWVCPKIE